MLARQGCRGLDTICSELGGRCRTGSGSGSSQRAYATAGRRRSAGSPRARRAPATSARRTAGGACCDIQLGIGPSRRAPNLARRRGGARRTAGEHSSPRHGDHPRRARPASVRPYLRATPSSPRGRRADRGSVSQHGGAGDPDRERAVPRLPADALRAAMGRLRRDARRPSRHRVALAIFLATRVSPQPPQIVRVFRDDMAPRRADRAADRFVATEKLQETDAKPTPAAAGRPRSRGGPSTSGSP